MKVEVCTIAVCQMEAMLHLFYAGDASEPAEGAVVLPRAVQGSPQPDLVQMILLPLVEPARAACHVCYDVLSSQINHRYESMDLLCASLLLGKLRELEYSKSCCPRSLMLGTYIEARQGNTVVSITVESCRGHTV